MKAPTQDLSKFSHEDLLQFAKDSQSNNEYQQRVIDSFSDDLTKRGQLAGLALQGILANNSYDAPRRTKLEGMAIDAVAAADALLKELDK